MPTRLILTPAQQIKVENLLSQGQHLQTPLTPYRPLTALVDKAPPTTLRTVLQAIRNQGLYTSIIKVYYWRTSWADLVNSTRPSPTLKLSDWMLPEGEGTEMIKKEDVWKRIEEIMGGKARCYYTQGGGIVRWDNINHRYVFTEAPEGYSVGDFMPEEWGVEYCLLKETQDEESTGEAHNVCFV